MLIIAGAGGPGTIFFNQGDSPGIGKLIIDNFAKNPYVYKTDSTTKEFDAITQGKNQYTIIERSSAVWHMPSTGCCNRLLSFSEK